VKTLTKAEHTRLASRLQRPVTWPPVHTRRFDVTLFAAERDRS
jgi:hypothetical protein